MLKYVVVILALVMVKVGNGKPRVSPVVLDRVGVEIDLKKNDRGQYQFAGTGKILMEQILSSEGEKSDGITMQTSNVCAIPVSVEIPGEMPGLSDALTAKMKVFLTNTGVPDSSENTNFTTGFFGFSKGQAHELTGGSYKGLFGRYSFRLAKQLDGVDTNGVTGVVNDSGMGLMLPIGSDFNRLLVVDIQPIPESALETNGMCDSVRRNGFVIKN